MNKKIVEYAVVYSKKGLRELEQEVNTMIEEGWQPLGGICSSYGGEGPAYQAMVQYEEVEA